jgi:hypothetical protein
MMHVQLPVRREITLSEAVTAFVYGKPCDPPPNPFHSYALDALLKRLHRAARAGQISFHAVKLGKNQYQEIKTGFFRKKCNFNWRQNQIEHLIPNDPDSEYDWKWAMAWDDVHIDREQFASLLKDMSVSVQQNLDPGAPKDLEAEVPADLSNLETSGTGLAGRGRPYSTFYR